MTSTYSVGVELPVRGFYFEVVFRRWSLTVADMTGRRGLSISPDGDPGRSSSSSSISERLPSLFSSQLTRAPGSHGACWEAEPAGAGTPGCVFLAVCVSVILCRGRCMWWKDHRLLVDWSGPAGGWGWGSVGWGEWTRAAVTRTGPSKCR